MSTSYNPILFCSMPNILKLCSQKFSVYSRTQFKVLRINILKHIHLIFSSFTDANCALETPLLKQPREKCYFRTRQVETHTYMNLLY